MRAAHDRRAPAARCSSPCARQDRGNRARADREPAHGSLRRCTFRPVATSASKRAATLTPSPIRLSPSTTTSPRLMPMRNRMRLARASRRSVGRVASWISVAHRTASTGLANSAMTLSPALPKTRPAMLGDQPVDDLAMGLEGRKRALLVLAHQPAVADHIGCKDGSHSALNAIHGHCKLLRYGTSYGKRYAMRRGPNRPRSASEPGSSQRRLYGFSSNTFSGRLPPCASNGLVETLTLPRRMSA